MHHCTDTMITEDIIFLLPRWFVRTGKIETRVTYRMCRTEQTWSRKTKCTSSPLTKWSPSMQLLPRFNTIPILRYMLGLNITLATEGTSQTFLRIMHCPWFTMSYKHARWVPDKSFIDIIHRGLDHYGTSSILVALIGSLYCHIIMKTYSSVLTVVGGWPS